MMNAQEAKSALLRMAELREEYERLEASLRKDWFEDLSTMAVGAIYQNCTIDQEGLKNCNGKLLSRDGRCMTEALPYFVNQSCGYLGDDYYGTMFVNVDDSGTFVAIGYSC